VGEPSSSHGYEEPFNVRYWQIGNEEWGSWELGQLAPQENAVRCREWAKAIKRLDPSLKVLAVGCYEPAQAVDWNLAVLREAWEYIDFLTVHTYWPFDPNADGGDYERVLSGPHRTDCRSMPADCGQSLRGVPGRQPQDVRCMIVGSS
jgi:alpha-N-arabinofuranosidase